MARATGDKSNHWKYRDRFFQTLEIPRPDLALLAHSTTALRLQPPSGIEKVL